MPAEYLKWQLTPAEQQKYQDWIARIMTGHTGTRESRNETLNWQPLRKPLSECVVGLFTTGGVHRQSDLPFDVANPHGDPSFRVIPGDVRVGDLSITHTHYNHVDADRDINCMFPIERLRELADLGVVGGVAPRAYAIMGFNPDSRRLEEETAPAVARGYQEDGVDLVFMTCG